MPILFCAAVVVFAAAADCPPISEPELAELPAGPLPDPEEDADVPTLVEDPLEAELDEL